MLRDILESALNEIRMREARDGSVMADSVEMKLNRSLEKYESNLQDTCMYILSRNPISIMKGINKEFLNQDGEE